VRQRYRLIDVERLCWRLQAGSIEEVRQHLTASLTERIARDDVKRQACWTESLAVGSQVQSDEKPRWWRQLATGGLCKNQ
jgi:hypothetical protein